MEKVTDELVELAELFKAIGHPVRLCIVRGLTEHGCNVSRMQECMSLPQPTVSKHVGILREKGIIKGYRTGQEIIYKLVDKDVRKIVSILMDKTQKESPNNKRKEA